ncbi:tRNA-specific 2-thiouridylase [Ruminococcus sp. YE71]|uniref:tRNA 2-thiouridine(34) synthase MnmA n=1 Tax=unclassified Ruminococcus TaxID=2608920 RepID=UPI00089091E2|nr:MULTISPECIES: tRNA 2-thiouridine(34) synthase MnmA [unclassified Ruminococcus]SDA18882.1 tRNA-specific 2-thiouridylase [Ruminococcus sp. YE78]SFW29064.1 tRNA-specific 2-thiouridylase [Ruminococcus sp. YE71]
MDKKRVLCALSGGADSSAAAKLLLEEGYEVEGASMFLCLPDCIDDAKKVAEKLGIRFHPFVLIHTFEQKVIEDFIVTYLRGGTPNPCIECNKYLKFGKFLDMALELGFDYIATGHYVRREFDEKLGRWQLMRSPNREKDQSYVLYGLTQEQLAHTLFPVGCMNKSEILDIVHGDGLVSEDKPESQDICFIPDGDYAGFITRRVGEPPHGDILLTDGTKLGEHKGLMRYTIGQRKGIGVSYSERLFVVDKRRRDNTLILGREDELCRSELTACELNLVRYADLPDGFRCTCQTRYHQKDVPCTLHPLGEGRIRVEFDLPHRAICRGQSVVFYDGNYVVGGGKIE